MKKVLVTGASGFLGSLLVKKLLENNVEVIATDINSLDDEIAPHVRFVKADMADFEKNMSEIRDDDIDVIYHMAWRGSSGNSRADYAMQLSNVRHTCEIVNAAAKMGIKRFVGAGTLAQLDCLAYIGENNATPNAVSCYGTAKITAQYMSKALANTAGIEHIWCILSNIYGIGDRTSNFINFASKKMLRGERASFTSGEQNYDFVYVSDIIQGLYLCGERGKNNSTYYIGSGKARPLKEYIKIVRDTIDTNIPVYFGEVDFNGKSLPLEAYSCQNITTDTGYFAEVDFECGIIKTIEWLKEEMEENINV